MAKHFTDNDGPLGQAPDISVGASDALLLAVSFGGFCMLAWSIYSIVLTKLKTSKELQDEEDAREISYDERLVRMDVSTLNRAQRRARARHIMKQQRKLATTDAEHDLLLLEEDGNNNANVHDENVPAFREDSHVNAAQHLLSRKERQKAAKQVELQERKVMEGNRRREQRKAQDRAMAKRKEKERLQIIRAETERNTRIAKKQADELADYRAWKIFLESSNRTQDDKTNDDDHDTDANRQTNAITVREWIRELKQQRIAYLKDLADRFQLDETVVRDRIRELLDASRLSGILEPSCDGKEGDSCDANNTKNSNGHRARFIYISPEDMSELASFVKAQDKITPRDFARHLQEQLQV